MTDLLMYLSFVMNLPSVFVCIIDIYEWIDKHRHAVSQILAEDEQV